MSAFDPKSLGKVVVAVAGTPVPIKATGFTVRNVVIQSDPANVGTFMSVKDAAGNVIAKLTKGQAYTPPMMATGVGIDLSQVQLDTDTNGDGCFVAYV